MANATIAQSSNVLGRFIEKECGHVFEYGNNDSSWMADLYPHQVYVGYLGEARIARVIKTRAFVVVDEDANGLPIVQTWDIKNRMEF